ncbi:MAG: hypothetical protein P1S60_07270, partial [Anaerolineae bacterium]|nr:hypothetical protein [Anaerolineae bacterium]
MTRNGNFLPQNRKIHRKPSFIFFLALICSLVSGCGGNWQVEISSPGGDSYVVNAEILKSLADFEDQEQGLPLERVLWTAGYDVVNAVTFVEPDGNRHEMLWPDVAGGTWWGKRNNIFVLSQKIPVARIEVTPPVQLSSVEVRITDIAPAAAAALGIPWQMQAETTVLAALRSEHVIMLFLDGFGYIRFIQARADGLIPNLAGLPEPWVGVTEYPPSTR